MDVQTGVTVEGPAGTAEIRWGYHRAARLGAWSLARDGTLTATLLDFDPVRVTQSSLTFVVLRAKGVPWTWPVLALTVTDDRLTATLGPKESVH